MLELSCDVHLVYVLCTWCIPLYSNKIDYLSKNEALRGSDGVAFPWKSVWRTKAPKNLAVFV